MVRANYLRVFTVLGAVIAMAVVSALLVTHAWAISGCDGDGPCPPGVRSTVPSDGKTGVDRDRSIKVQFLSETVPVMTESSIDGQTVKLYQGNLTYEQLNPACGTSECAPPQPVSATVSYDASTSIATLDPESRLQKKTEYTAVVEGAGDSDALAVKDGQGNEMRIDRIWHFKTGRR